MDSRDFGSSDSLSTLGTEVASSNRTATTGASTTNNDSSQFKSSDSPTHSMMTPQTKPHLGVNTNLDVHLPPIEPKTPSLGSAKRVLRKGEKIIGNYQKTDRASPSPMRVKRIMSENSIAEADESGGD